MGDRTGGKEGLLELRGNLKDFSLPDIIQLVAFGRKTGALRVAYNGGGSALYFETGDVVHAEFPGLSGEKAVYALFRVESGEFSFETGVPTPKRTITMDSTNLVMEAARLLDEANRDGNADLPAPPLPDGGDDWFDLGASTPDPAQVKDEIKKLLNERFGRKARRLLQAVDRCEDSLEALEELVGRIEKYVRVFLDARVAQQVAAEIRALLSGSSPGS